jgi:predicted NBD/HSP70 family sugar kinase
MTEAMVPAGQHTVRLHNLRLVLTEIATAPGSRADLAQRTGLTKATVASLADPFIERGILLEGHPEAAGPGRPSRLLSFHPDGPVAVGVEINVDYTALSLVDLTGRLVSYQRAEVDNRVLSAVEIVATAGRLCRDFLTGTARPLLGVGLGVPGAVGPGGVVVRAPNLPALNADRVGVRFAGELPPALATTVLVENEANLGALAWSRAAADVEPNFVYVSGEIGVGAGLMVDGELFRGVHGFAGELGHIVVERDGPQCGCGGRGCVEQYAGQDVLLAAAGSASVEALEAAVLRDDPAALAAVAQAGAALGVGLASLLNVVDLPLVVLGGLYARLYEVITPALQRELRQRALSSGRGGAQLRRSELAGDAAVRGAAGLIVDRALKQPLRLTGFAG